MQARPQRLGTCALYAVPYTQHVRIYAVQRSYMTAVEHFAALEQINKVHSMHAMATCALLHACFIDESKILLVHGLHDPHQSAATHCAGIAQTAVLQPAAILTNVIIMVEGGWGASS